jgi:hypothetical protein
MYYVSLLSLIKQVSKLRLLQVQPYITKHTQYIRARYMYCALLELYLYIVVSLIVRVFPAYFTPVHVLYIVAFGPSGIQVAYS